MNSYLTWISRPLAALSLRARLALAFGLALLLTATLMGAALWGAQRASDTVTRLHDVEFPAEEHVLHVRALLLDARRFEKEFMLRWRELGFDEARTRYVNLLQANLAEIPPRLAEIERLRAADPKTVELTGEIGRAVVDYRRNFLAAVDSIKRLGLVDTEQEEDFRRAYLTAAARTESPLQQLEQQADERLGAIHEQAKAAMRQNSIVVLGTGTFALLLGLLVAVTLWRSIMLAVDNAVAFAEKIAGGDLSARFPPHDGGEFGRLASALDRMAGSLQHSRDTLQAVNAELEQRIARRTLHLRAANRGLSERTHEMTLLADLTEWLLVSNSCAEVHRSIGHFFTQLFPQGSGRLYLRRNDTGAFDSRAEWGAPCRAAPTLAADSCLALRQGLSQCACEDHPGAACLQGQPQPAALCVPLISQRETFGMIYLELPATGGVSGAGIDPSDKMLAAIIVKQVALGLTNLRLREALREQAIRDALTGLYNRRYLEETLAREIERARRKQGKLSAIMLDVDHFKRFNDTYGHEAGDVVLAAIGRLLREAVRASDVACRFGGEEFTVLLPDTDVVLAAERAELIRRAAHELTLEYGGKVLPGVTISLGAAEFPQHGETGADLVAAADAALYRAKEGGRDRVAVALALSPSPPAPLPQAGEGSQISPLPFMGEGSGERVR